jgi:Major Facilitator Superfamily
MSTREVYTPSQLSSTDSRPNADVRDNLRYSMGDAASFGAMVGLGETYLPAFALALGMGETSAGLVASLPVVAGGCMQLVSLRLAKFVQTDQRWVVLCATIQALSFLPLVLAALYGSISMPMLMLIASVYWASGLASGPAWNTWMESIVPAGVRASYFSRRSRLQQSFTFLALMASGVFLQAAESGNWALAGFAAIFIAAAIARVISVLCLMAHRTDHRLATRSENQLGQNYSGSVTRSGRRLLIYLVFVQACVQISGPFFAPFMLKQLGFSYIQYVFLLAVSFLSRIIAMTQWTKVANRFGASTLLWIGAVGLVPIASLWIISTQIWWLAIAQICSGIVWAAYELGFFLLFFETLPPNRRTKMLTYYNFGNTLAMFAGASIGAILLDSFGVTPRAYFVLFAVSSVGRGIALLLLLRTNLRPVPIRAIAIRVLGIRDNSGSLDVPVLSSLHPESKTEGDHLE